ncbi:MAG: hypothetical protein V4714_07780 [Bacteroidota bacterium]
MNDINGQFAQETTEKQTESRKLLEEIRELEAKITEVNQLLYRHSLDSTVRLQLRDDLEYYQQSIEKKLALLRQIHEAKK